MAHLPKYEQVKKALLAELRNGVYPPGERIPTREELIKKFGVTRTTVNQALKELVNCGVLATSRRGGTVFTGKQPPLKIALLTSLARKVADQSRLRESTDIDLLNPLLYHAAEFNLDFIDPKSFTPDAEFIDRYDCVVAIMPGDSLMEALAHYSGKVLFVNRYGEHFNFISTNHRAAVRELTRHNLAAAGPESQVFFLAARVLTGFVERERTAGFVDECAAHERFYRICEFDAGDREKSVAGLLDGLSVRPGRPLVICAPSLSCTGAVIQWAHEKKLVFGRDIFYSDFDNPQVRRVTGEIIASAGQDYAAMGEALYLALSSWDSQRQHRQFIPCRLVF